jgi:hypothetical protein
MQMGTGTPRAAHEKIAADLARLLGVPVPPVLLWTNQADGSKYSISSWAYKQPNTWDVMAPAMTDLFKENAYKTIGDAIVFHTWVADIDRHAQNTLVDADSSDNNPRICFIDHAFSLSHSQEFGNQTFTRAVHRYVPAGAVDERGLAHMARMIEAMAPESVESVVRRIPEGFLSPTRADIIVRELLRRKAAICLLLGIDGG